MHWISHRGNLNGGSERGKENHPEQIVHCLEHGFEVEVDVWYTGDGFYLGHSEPQYSVDVGFISHPKIWLHCKNIHALQMLRSLPKANCFFHNKDDCALTSKRYIWLHPLHKVVVPGAICVLPEDPRWTFKPEHILDFGGVCSDNIYYYKEYVTNLRR